MTPTPTPEIGRRPPRLATPGVDPGALVVSVRGWVWLRSARYCRRRGRPDLADDLAGEVLARLLRAAGGYDPGRGRPTTWAAAVLRTYLPRLYDAIERPVRVPIGGGRSPRLRPDYDRARRARAIPLTRGLGPEAAPFDLVDPRGGPELGAIEVERAAILRRALSGLPDRERRVVSSYFGVDAPRLLYPEIGRELGVTPQRARQICAAGLALLRERLEAAGGVP